MSAGTRSPRDEDRGSAADDAADPSPGAAPGEPVSPSARLISQPASKKGARTLTAAQLEKKRANDREAQRAIRERTKNQIETLEKRIKDLESGLAYQQLQDALKQKQVVEAENQDLRHRLAGIVDILRPLFPPEQFQNIVTTTAGPPLLSSSNAATSPVAVAPELPQVVTAREPPYNSQVPGHEATPAATPTSWADNRTHMSSPGPLWEQSKSNNYQRVGRAASDDRTSMSNGVTPTAAPHKRRRSAFESSNGHSPTAHTDPDQFSTPIFAQLPANINPTCRYDNIIYDFTTVSRRRLAAGESLRDLLGGDEAVLNGLVDPTSELANCSYYSTLLIDLLKGFSAINRWPEKIAIVAHLFPFIRWMISPTKENFDAVPLYMQPVEAQLKIPHPIWVDHLPWPSMRHKMVYQYPWLPLDNFFMPYTKKLSINYPHQDLQSCLYQDPKTGKMHIHRDLYEHGRVLDNWSVGPEFAKAHPILAETCRIKDE